MTCRILLTGGAGQVGSELLRVLPKLGEVAAPARNELDLLRPIDIRRVVRETRPAVIVNAAAYTAVDAAETHAAEARAINAEAPALLAHEARKIGAVIVHYSTDYVFNGQKKAPYIETDATAPLGVYGQTKLEGERAIQESGTSHVIIRTAWVYGTRGRNFLLTILRLASECEELRIVSDQLGAPTLAKEIAAGTLKILEGSIEEHEEKRGLFHLTAAGETSWHGFAEAIVEEAAAVRGKETKWMLAAIPGRDLRVKRVTAISSAEYPTPARRPAYSVLSNKKVGDTFAVRLPDWREQLRSIFRGNDM